MAAARLKKTNLCEECFPYGMADQPEDATVVSCEHGAWDAKALKPKDPETPPENPPNPETPETPEGGKGAGSGEGSGEGDGK